MLLWQSHDRYLHLHMYENQLVTTISRRREMIGYARARAPSFARTIRESIVRYPWNVDFYGLDIESATIVLYIYIVEFIGHLMWHTTGPTNHMLEIFLYDGRRTIRLINKESASRCRNYSSFCAAVDTGRYDSLSCESTYHIIIKCW